MVPAWVFEYLEAVNEAIAIANAAPGYLRAVVDPNPRY